MFLVPHVLNGHFVHICPAITHSRALPVAVVLMLLPCLLLPNACSSVQETPPWSHPTSFLYTSQSHYRSVAVTHDAMLVLIHLSSSSTPSPHCLRRASVHQEGLEGRHVWHLPHLLLSVQIHGVYKKKSQLFLGYRVSCSQVVQFKVTNMVFYFPKTSLERGIAFLLTIISQNVL